jgi:hypothetical protein
VRIALPTPTELWRFLRNPESGNTLVASTRAGKHEAPVLLKHRRVIEQEGDTFVDGEWCSLSMTNSWRRVNGWHSAELLASFYVDGEIERIRRHAQLWQRLVNLETTFAMVAVDEAG